MVIDPELLDFLISGATTVERIESAKDLKLQGKVQENETKLFAKISKKQEGSRIHTPSINYDTGEFICSCEDFMYKRMLCKHIMFLLRNILKRRKTKFKSFLEAYIKGGKKDFSLAKTSISTGVKPIDELLFGGWPTEVLTILTGESKVGKTWLMFQSGAHNAANSGKTLYVDLEGVYVREDAVDRMVGYFSKRFGQFYDNFHIYAKARSIEDLGQLFGIGFNVRTTENMISVNTYDLTEADQFPLYQLVKKHRYNLVVIDSLSNPIKERIPVPPNQNRPGRAAILNPLLGRVEKLAEDFDCAVVVIIHLSKDEGAARGNLPRTDPDRWGKVWGGETLKYNVKYVVQIRQGWQSQLTDSEKAMDTEPKKIIRREWVGVKESDVVTKIVKDVGYVDINYGR